MNKVQQSIYDTVVRPAIKSLAGLMIAEVRHVNYTTKRAIIAIEQPDDPQRTDESYIIEVPIVRQQGVHESGPYPGDQVLVGFINNDHRHPVIIGTIDLMYNTRRGDNRDPHPGKGARLTDLYCARKADCGYGAGVQPRGGQGIGDQVDEIDMSMQFGNLRPYYGG
jgi:hypothetical protein